MRKKKLNLLGAGEGVRLGGVGETVCPVGFESSGLADSPGTILRNANGSVGCPGTKRAKPGGGGVPDSSTSAPESIGSIVEIVDGADSAVKIL